MMEVATPAEMDRHVGEKLGSSEWLTVSQDMIDAFAAATGDDQWIHVDRARAAREMPGGRTIAHGYLTLSLLPRLSRDIYRIRARSRAINYGCNKVRFTNPVPAGARIRSHVTLKASEPIEGGRRLTFESTVEIEGQDRPALVAETIALVFG
jgi:acyl dehydratase